MIHDAFEVTADSPRLPAGRIFIFPRRKDNLQLTTVNYVKAGLPTQGGRAECATPDVTAVPSIGGGEGGRGVGE